MASTERTRIRRGANRGVSDTQTIYRILDDCLVCHVGFTVAGEARVIPTAFLRVGDAIYLHGNRRNQMLNALLDGQTACISVMQLDGLVLARSGMHSSVNYRSVVVYGRATAVENKLPYLNGFIDKLASGRAAEVRPHTPQELNATLVLRVAIDESSAKIRSGPPVDDDADYALNIWAGVLPLQIRQGEPEACPKLAAGIALPAYARNNRDGSTV